MTSVRSAVKPICASPSVAAHTDPGARIRQRMADHSLRMGCGARGRIRPFRGTLDSDGRGPILRRGDFYFVIAGLEGAISSTTSETPGTARKGRPAGGAGDGLKLDREEPDEREDRNAAQGARHRIAAAGGTGGELRAVYGLRQSRLHLRPDLPMEWRAPLYRQARRRDQHRRWPGGGKALRAQHPRASARRL